MQNTFYLIRHGQKESQIGDPPLTKFGQLQAQHTAEYLEQFPISALIASPLLRTQQTAQVIADTFQLPIQTDPLLKERMNWGDVEDQPFEEFMVEWTKSSQDRTYQAAGYSSSQQTGKRIEELIEKYRSEKEAHLALVTHGGAIADFLRNIFPQSQLETLVSDTHLPKNK